MRGLWKWELWSSEEWELRASPMKWGHVPSLPHSCAGQLGCPQ